MKLSLLVVEVTILLSNIDDINQKVIKIKPIKTVHEQQPSHEEDERDKLKHEIAFYQKELDNLKAKLDKELQETTSMIEHEKEMWEQEKQVLAEQAKEEGYNNGFVVGKQEGRAEFEQLIAKVNTLRLSINC